MRWIIDPKIREDGAAGIAWARQFLAGYDTSQVEWLRIDRGNERLDCWEPRGVYGRCYYPRGRGKARRGYRISCQVPGPYPYTMRLRLPPVYTTLVRYYGERPDHVLDAAGSAVFEIGRENGAPYWDVADVPRPANCAGTGRRGDKAWWQIDGLTTVNSLSEAIVWIVGHEAFHFLRRSRQVPGRNVEHEADMAGERALSAFRAAA
jgi:hypothetical protein